ncbi:MAG: hypothetical protein FWG38_11175 [Defluviitaleaceae bacterium]|nr:hypothetical protein [Defluviitaleaceae bacterium]
MDEQRSFLKEFLRLTPKTFAYTILFATITGWLFGDRLEDFFNVLISGNQGLSYQHIFQIFLLSAVNSAISTFVNTSKWFKNILELWCSLITMVTCLAATAAVVAWFGWIPLSAWRTWLVFIAGFLAIFFALFIIMVVITTREDKQYNRLLSNYKKQNNKDHP